MIVEYVITIIIFVVHISIHSFITYPLNISLPIIIFYQDKTIEVRIRSKKISSVQKAASGSVPGVYPGNEDRVRKGRWREPDPRVLLARRGLIQGHPGGIRGLAHDPAQLPSPGRDRCQEAPGKYFPQRGPRRTWDVGSDRLMDTVTAPLSRDHEEAAKGIPAAYQGLRRMKRAILWDTFVA